MAGSEGLLQLILRLPPSSLPPSLLYPLFSIPPFLLFSLSLFFPSSLLFSFFFLKREKEDAIIILILFNIFNPWYSVDTPIQVFCWFYNDLKGQLSGFELYGNCIWPFEDGIRAENLQCTLKFYFHLLRVMPQATLCFKASNNLVVLKSI